MKLTNKEWEMIDDALSCLMGEMCYCKQDELPYQRLRSKIAKQRAEEKKEKKEKEDKEDKEDE